MIKQLLCNPCNKVPDAFPLWGAMCETCFLKSREEQELFELDQWQLEVIKINKMKVKTTKEYREWRTEMGFCEKFQPKRTK